jgi:hypothetical protein
MTSAGSGLAWIVQWIVGYKVNGVPLELMEW